jgi:phenylacetate-CoA ligase
MVLPTLPNYFRSNDFEGLFRDHPPPEDFVEGMHLWSSDRLRAHQEVLFQGVIEAAWANPFYAQRWRRDGIEPGDIGGLDDIGRLPVISVEDFKDSIGAEPPFGLHQVLHRSEPPQPIKVQSSGGTTGRPRPTLFTVREWEVQGIQTARALYLQGARPGDVMQIPVTLSTANLGWCYFQACFYYLGIAVITTGSGLVTPSRRQIEEAEAWGTNMMVAFPEYLLTLGHTAVEMGVEPESLGLKLLSTYLGPDTAGHLRAELEELWHCPVYDNYGTHEIGVVSFECTERNGLHFNEDTIFVEIGDIETGEVSTEIGTGNLIATSLHRHHPPLIRYNLMDRIELLPRGQCACGSHSLRMGQFLGRSDDMIKIRGTNIYPMACLNAVQSQPGTTGEWLCIVDRVTRGIRTEDQLTVAVELDKGVAPTEKLHSELASGLQNDLGVKVIVELVDLGALDSMTNRGREGKVRRLLDRRPGHERQY